VDEGSGRADDSRDEGNNTAKAIRRAVLIAKLAGVEAVEDGLMEIMEVFGPRGWDVIAMFGPETGRIYINGEHEHWSDPAAYVRKRYHLRPRWFSTRSIDHVIRHEIGHALHWRRFDPVEVDVYWEGRFNEKEQAMIRATVSWFASTSTQDFIGEVYAGLLAGRSYPVAVMEIYWRLKGPVR